MDKILCIELVLVIFAIICHCSNSSIYLDDEDDDSPWNRCPYIRNKLKNGRVKIRNRGRIAKFVCDPGYDLAGKRFATCVRGQWNNPVPMCVSRGCFKLPEVPNGRVTEMYRGAVLMYDCLPGYALEGPSTLYCDGRHWSSVVPTCMVAATEIHTSCDFEDPNICSWMQDPSHDFDWKRNQFSTPSGHAGTGPSYDHTFGIGKGGYYLYGEASAPRKPGDVSRLFSPVYSPELSGGCFLFWYHMYGSTIGSLKVYVKPESHVFGELAPAWELSGDQGDQWLRGNVSIPKLTENFQIIVEGVRGSNYIGDTAIDDVYLSSLGCEEASASTESVPVLTSNSCRGRCREFDNSSHCACTDNCHSNGNCCYDFDFICTGNADSDNESPPEEHDYLTTTIVIPIVTVKKNENTTSNFNTSDVFTSTPSSISISMYTEANNVSTASVTLPHITISSVYTDNVSNSSNIQTLSNSSQILTSSSSATSPSTAITVSLPSSNATLPIIIKNTTASLVTSTSTTKQSTTSTTLSTSTTRQTSITSTTIPTTTSFSSTITSPITSTNSSSTMTSASPIIIEKLSTSLKTLSPVNVTSETPISIASLKSVTSESLNNSLTTTVLPAIITSTLPTNISSGDSSISPVVPSQINITAPAPATIAASLSSQSTSRTSNDILLNSSPLIITEPTTTTRRIYNLRPRNRKTTTATTTKMYNLRPRTRIITSTTTITTTISTLTPRYLPLSTRNWNNAYQTTTTKLPQVTSTSTRAFTPVSKMLSTFSPFMSTSTELPSKPVDAHASKSALNERQPTVAIVSIIIVGIICAIIGGIYFMRKRSAERQLKLSDDSEMRFLSENEIAEYSDPTCLDKMLTH